MLHGHMEKTSKGVSPFCMDMDKDTACVIMSGKSFVCAHNWRLTVHRIVYVYGCIYAYRGLCNSLHCSLHHSWHQFFQNHCWTSVWGKEKCCNRQNFGYRKQQFLGPVLWVALYRSLWFCWSKAWLDHTCFFTGKKECWEMAQEVIQVTDMSIR